MTVLTRRALNRATLARQHLLVPSTMPVPEMVEHLAGLQAQEPEAPFIGLWSRLAAFDPAALDAMLLDRDAVRTHLMRRTVHLLPARDALAWRTRHDAMLVQRMLAVARAELPGVDLDALAATGREILADGEPRTMPALGRGAAERGVPGTPRWLGEALHSLLALVQIPPRGLWQTTAPAACLLYRTWLGREPDPLPDDDTDPVGQELVLRYLAAYGPAASADLRSWCGLAGLPAAVTAVRGQLVTSRDERGRELFDLPDAPRPDPDTEAPVRFLPAFDNAVLGYDDRSRIVDDEHKGLSVHGARFVLVDGRVAATWVVRDSVLEITPLVRMSRADRSAVIAEGHRLQTFLGNGRDGKVRVAAAR